MESRWGEELARYPAKDMFVYIYIYTGKQFVHSWNPKANQFQMDGQWSFKAMNFVDGRSLKCQSMAFFWNIQSPPKNPFHRLPFEINPVILFRTPLVAPFGMFATLNLLDRLQEVQSHKQDKMQAPCEREQTGYPANPSTQSGASYP